MALSLPPHHLLQRSAFWIAGDLSPLIQGSIQHAAPNARIEYRGSVTTASASYFLFSLSQDALAGLVVIREQPGAAPKIAFADTAFRPIASGISPAVQEGLEALLRKRGDSSHSSAGGKIGQRIDEIIDPISGIRFGTNSTIELLRLLQTGRTLSVDPNLAAPGSIIVSPTHLSQTGEVALGHAGILGFNGEIYSADARFGGAWAKNFTLKQWQTRFSEVNGTYAFVLGANPTGMPKNTR
jgi:hypothetical protein